MINQMTIDQTAELSNQELSLEQLEDVQGGIAPLVVAGGIAAGAAAAYGAYKLGKWLVKKVGQATTNLDNDSDSGDSRDSGDGANKLSFYEMRKPTTLIV